MKGQAIEMGLSVDQFLSITYADFIRHVMADYRERKQERKDILRTAWYTAAFKRMRKMPKLNRVLNPPKTRNLEGEEARRMRGRHKDIEKGLLNNDDDIETITEKER